MAAKKKTVATVAKRSSAKKAVATVAKRSSAKKEVPLTSLITTCLRGISELYPAEQNPAPGLVLSFLPSGEFYASFARYQDGQKIVTNSAQGKTLEEAVHNLVLAWKAGTCHARDLAAVGRTLNVPIPQPFKTGTMNETAGIKSLAPGAQAMAMQRTKEWLAYRR